VFFRGQAAMAMRGPWAISAGKEEFPEFEFIYAEMPPYHEPRKFAAESGWGEVVNAKADPKVKEAAWKFIEFMHHDENMRDWNTITFTIPSLKSLQNDAQILAKAPELKVAFDVISAGQWVGPVQNRDRFWQTISDALTAVALGQMSAADALRDAEQKINAMIDEYVGP
jgi:multiple sugar transport system substrate-binding protein